MLPLPVSLVASDSPAHQQTEPTEPKDSNQMMKTVILNSYLPLFMMADIGGAGADADSQLGGLEVETGFLSLAALAGMDTDSIATLTSRVPTAGLWIVRGKKVAGSEGEPKDGKPPLIRFNYHYEVMGGKATDPAFDNDKMVGRTITESVTLWPNDLATGIGLLKGRYQKAGLPNSGMPMGGVEGKQPGWMDTVVGAEFVLQIRNYLKDGETRASFDWKPAAVAAEEAEE